MYEESIDDFFGDYGGKYIPEILHSAIDELDSAFNFYIHDKDFLDELNILRRDYIGRETPLMFAERATELLGGGNLLSNSSASFESMKYPSGSLNVPPLASFTWSRKPGISSFIRK